MKRSLIFIKHSIVNLLLILLFVRGIDQKVAAIERFERKAILDAIRPVAIKMAGQPIRFKVDRLNQDKNWAVLIGELVGSPGKVLNWELVEGCYPELDKMLWVVLNKAGHTWQVKHIDICASEPPYWYMEQFGGLIWPCGVFAGLKDTSGASLEQECRSQQVNKVH